ncbi:MAG: Flagellar hook-length control protein FliK [Myxococcaceae bacterium]|nr:Flagellar hook-length control protein FliK [Myxococcaceae bacterium]
MLTHRHALGLLVVATTACSSVPPPEETASSESAVAAALTEVTGFGTNPGALKMFEHVPAKLAVAPALVLVLHGCTQGAADAAANFGWNELSDELGFVAVYPEQQQANNPLRCFNWAGEYGDPANVQRGKGENESLKEMVDKAIALHGIAPKKVFVVGFSAGAAEAAVALATWPDVFAGGAIFAGVPFMCTTTYSEVSACQKPGKDKTPQQWGDLVRAADSGFAGPWPRVSIWQGSADTTVGTANRVELVEQWTNVHGLAATPSASDTVDGQKHDVFKSASGVTLVETYEVAAMAHAVPVVPGKQCGTAGTYGVDKGICGARRAAEFFGLTVASAPGKDGGPEASTGGPSGPTTDGGSIAVDEAGTDATMSGTGNGNGAAPNEGFDRPNAATCAATPCGEPRRDPSAWLATAFAVLALAVARRRGAKAST